MPLSRTLRIGLFALACVALSAAAVLFASADRPGRPAGSAIGPGSAVGRAHGPLRGARRLLRSLRRSARRFLAAYLRYEVGEDGGSVRRELRLTATGRFAALLLANPVRRESRAAPSAPARLRRLEVRVDPADPRHALLGGVAARGARTERFSFEFIHGDSGWRASGVGE